MNGLPFYEEIPNFEMLHFFITASLNAHNVNSVAHTSLTLFLDTDDFASRSNISSATLAIDDATWVVI